MVRMLRAVIVDPATTVVELVKCDLHSGTGGQGAGVFRMRVVGGYVNTVLGVGRWVVRARERG